MYTWQSPVAQSKMQRSFILASLWSRAGGSSLDGASDVPLVPSDRWARPISNVSRCNIPIAESLSIDEFIRDFKGRRPVIFSRPLSVTETFRSATADADILNEQFGELSVVLASSNSFSHDKMTTTLDGYLRDHTHPNNPSRLANESWYFFGDTFGPEWNVLLDTYPMPQDADGDDGLRVFGVAGQYSGA